MADIIHLLLDNVANQIAAGEVVQRPASAVKELMENSIDAGADSIQLILKDSGKSLIKVVDNGIGMSETDARMAFERHATSKIKTAEDIFAIHTKGFRGEALASIAAVAQIELKTRKKDEDLGSYIRIEGSKVMSQEFCNIPKGTQIEVKNLFYNIPARRNFLKSNNVELRHVIDEFERVALAHPNIHFSLIHNNSELFDLSKAQLRQRIVNVFGRKFNEKLVPVEEKTPILEIKGFIGKPEFAKRTRGEQFFFTNNRFIKNAYLHKSVCNAFEDLISEGAYPTYFLYLQLDATKIDVNIHPTKTEIKFEDEKAIYIIIRTAVKHSLGQFNIAPSLDFDTDQGFIMPTSSRNIEVKPPAIAIDPTFSPFDDKPKEERSSSFSGKASDISPTQDWESVWRSVPEIEVEDQAQQSVEIETQQDITKNYIQVGRKYILTNHGNGMIMVSQQRAHERILFDKFYTPIQSGNIPSQQLLFPQNITFTASDFQLLQNLMPALRELGFDISQFGKNEVVVNGIPLYLQTSELENALQTLAEKEKDFADNGQDEHYKIIASALAKVSAIKPGTYMNQEEMRNLMDELFATKSPYISLDGKPIIINLKPEDLDKSFN